MKKWLQNNPPSGMIDIVYFSILGHETVGCVRHSSSLNKCIQNAIQHYVTYMSNGKISDRIYVMSIDPLAFPNATLVRNRNIHTYFQSREMRGFKNSFVTDVK